jgi:hypothetical protein
LYGRAPGATIAVEEPPMQDVHNLADTIESLSARIVAIRDSL